MRVTDEDVKRVLFEAEQVIHCKAAGNRRQAGGHQSQVRRIVEGIVEREIRKVAVAQERQTKPSGGEK